MRPEYVRKLAGDLGMEIEPVQRAVLAAGNAPAGRRSPRAAPAPRRPRPTAGQPALAGRAGGAEARPAGAGAGRADVRRGRRDRLPRTRCTSRCARPSPRPAARPAATGGAVWIEAVRDACADLAAQALVGELAVEPLRIDGEPDPRYVSITMARLQLGLGDRPDPGPQVARSSGSTR